MATSISSALTSTGSINSAGIGSGLDVNAIVSQMMAVEGRPLQQMQSRAEQLESKLSNVGKLQSHFSTLQGRANALTSTALWSGTTATSSDANAVKVTASTSAAAGNHAISVSRLAATQTLASTALANPQATVGSGTLTIELGRWDEGSPAAGFTAKAGVSAVEISIGEEDTSLEAIRDKINAAKAGVTAAIVTDANGSRLTLRGAETGAENAFRIGVKESADDGDAASGLSMLAFDASVAGAQPMQRATTAANAELTVNGVAISATRNTLDNVVDGLSLTLQKTTEAEVSVAVSANTDAIKAAVNEFVSSFNTLASFIKTQTAYNAESKTGGALQGDQGTLALQQQLRAVLNAPSSASGVWGKLSEVGLVLKTDGTLESNATKLDNALTNLPELRNLLVGDADTNAGRGFVRRFKLLADAALGSQGAFEARNTGLRTMLDRNAKSQEDMEMRLSKTESRLRAQYQSLDTKMASLSSLSNYMSQQIAQLSA